ncbi:MAG: hypothetical protein ACRC9Q_08420 [Bacteroidales bacterium]
MKNQGTSVVYRWNNYYLTCLLLVFMLLALAFLFYSKTLMEIVLFLGVGIVQLALNLTLFRLKIEVRNEPYLKLGGWTLPMSRIVCAEANKYRLKIYYQEISGNDLKDKSFYIKNPADFMREWQLKEAIHSDRNENVSS